jgi:hypothetical protein
MLKQFHSYVFWLTKGSMVCRVIVAVFGCMTIHLAVSPVQAEIKTISAQGEYRMGPRDTKDDAIRLATESAKRHALEQVATYLESVTVVNAMDVTKDEIRTYTAGSVMVLDQHTTTTRDGDTTVVHVRLLTQIDTEEATRAIMALRENEDARSQLAALKRDHERLQRELSAVNRALAEAATSDQTMQVTRQRREVLHRVQSNAMVSQAWTDWAGGHQLDETRMQAGLASVYALLQAARDLYPASPHVTVAEKTMRDRQPPVPPQPPQPGTARARMPKHEIVPSPASGVVPRTLNEITYRTPAGPFHNGQEQDRKGE